MRRRRKRIAQKRALSLMQDNIGLALGLRNSRIEGRLADEASTYLRKHTQLFEEQMEDLRRNEISDVLGIVLQVFSVVVGVAVAAFVAVAVWQAAHSKTLVMEPISGPEDFQKNGLTPSVLSAQLLDQLRLIQEATDSARAPGTFGSNWTEDIEVEIPQTGLSIGEALRILRRWLGKDVRISGEVWKTASGLAMTARAGEAPAQTFKVPGEDVEPLIRQAAQSIYARTQPYRYSRYLWQNGKQAEAIEILKQLAEGGEPKERPWAHVGLAGMYSGMGDARATARESSRAVRLNRDLAAGWYLLANSHYVLGHDALMVPAYREVIRTVERPDGGGATKVAGAQYRLDARASLAEVHGDWMSAAALRRASGAMDEYQDSAATASAQEALNRIRAHQPLDPWSIKLDPDDTEAPLYRARMVAARAEAFGQWGPAVEQLERLQAEAAKLDGVEFRSQLWRTQIWPWQAYGYARTGRLDQARALIARTPTDCYLCLRLRARIEVQAGNRRGAQAWFARAVTIAPSLPFAYGEWGQALAGWGDHERAAAKLRLAARYGEAWPDARVWWGQSLLARGRRGEASKQFAAAAKLAPDWPLPRRLLAAVSGQRAG